MTHDEARDIRVLLVDDQDLVRAGFRIILESEDGIEVVGEATTGRAAVALASELQPDVICMDVQMPDMDGLQATELLTRDAKTDAAILIVTTFDRDDYLFAALKAGASGFLLKNAGPEELIDAVGIVARGDALIAPAMTRRVVEHFATSAQPGETAGTGGETHPGPARHSRLDVLTEREAEVLRLLAQGLSNSEIARRLFVGEATVKTHVSRILMKLDLRDRTQAVVFAYENGIVTPGSV
ncbi:response regulator transcription factor [Saxibacter everestensis]|uniref:Response regulator transcription factor n=1 Tax=Saxibacter everestensis TaxID=2909229 RepID=A0ABY8QTB0_9MICO|nr:response regulator transcription factor [Brevibacteriaceae bacterium ZFBP1038]